MKVTALKVDDSYFTIFPGMWVYCDGRGNVEIGDAEGKLYGRSQVKTIRTVDVNYDGPAIRSDEQTK